MRSDIPDKRVNNQVSKGADFGFHTRPATRRQKAPSGTGWTLIEALERFDVMECSSSSG